VHNLWLELDTNTDGAKLKHRDVVGVALRRLEADLHSAGREAVIADTRREAEGDHGGPDPRTSGF
jgi:hypothetical protein